MARSAYSEINLHITWHTKGNVCALVDTIETNLHRFLRARAVETNGVLIHAINGMPDHIHLAATIPPSINIADWIGQLKGASAHFINHEIANRKLIEWQSGYGVVSFGTRDLPWVVEYVRNQKQHHADGSIQDRLERTDRIEEAPAVLNPSDGKPAKAG